MHAYCVMVASSALPRPELGGRAAPTRCHRPSTLRSIAPTPAAQAVVRQHVWHSCGIGSSSSSSNNNGQRPATSRLPVATAAVNPALANLASDVLYEATGVPLVDELMKLATVSAASWHSLRLLAFLGAAAAAGTLLLRALDRAAGRQIRAADGTGRFNVAAEALAAAFAPCKLMLPIYCAARAATVVLALAVVSATKCGVDPGYLLTCRMDSQLLAALRWLALAAGGEAKQVQVMVGLQWATQLVQDCSELVVIVGLAWAAIEFKSRLIEWAAQRLQTDDDVHNDGIAPLLRLGNTGVTIAIVLVAAAIALAGFGFHIGPLLASVGGVGVVIGLATQQLLSNIVAAISLYSTRPFVTGDEVCLMNSEGVEVSGTVLNIEPTRTILLDQSSGCIVHVSNSDIGDYIIKNQSQFRALTRLQGQQQAAGSSSGATPTKTMQELVRAMRSTSILSYDDAGAEDPAVREDPAAGVSRGGGSSRGGFPASQPA